MDYMMYCCLFVQGCQLVVLMSKETNGCKWKQKKSSSDQKPRVAYGTEPVKYGAAAVTCTADKR